MAKGYRGGGRVGGGGGMPSAMKQNDLMKQAQKMQQEMLKVQEELENSTYTASSGGGVVTATVNGKHELLSLTIEPDAIDPEDAEMLQDLIIAAVNSAFRDAEETASASMAKVTGGLGSFGFGM